MNRCAVLTEIGPDRGALRPQDAGALLFDLGLGVHQVDCCVRTAEPELIAGLRAAAGRSLFEPDNPAMGLILRHGPNRVFATRAGRAEIYQPIPAPGGKAPDGPHSHVLPKLLAHGRTHAATEPIPRGLCPASTFIRRTRCATATAARPVQCRALRRVPADALALRRYRARQAQAQCRQGAECRGGTRGDRDAGGPVRASLNSHRLAPGQGERRTVGCLDRLVRGA